MCQAGLYSPFADCLLQSFQLCHAGFSIVGLKGQIERNLTFQGTQVTQIFRCD